MRGVLLLPPLIYLYYPDFLLWYFWIIQQPVIIIITPLLLESFDVGFLFCFFPEMVERGRTSICLNFICAYPIAQINASNASFYLVIKIFQLPFWHIESPICNFWVAFGMTMHAFHIWWFNMVLLNFWRMEVATFCHVHQIKNVWGLI